jgi:hypothetical protein
MCYEKRVAPSRNALLFALLSLLGSRPSRAAVLPVGDGEARLSAAWQALHRGQPLPAACPHPDPVRQATADFTSQSAGAETVLASLRFGVVLLSVQGQPLASWPLQCGQPTVRSTEPASQVVELRPLRASGRGPQDILLRTRQYGRCGHVGWWQLLHPQDGALELLLTTEDEVVRACGSGPSEHWTAQLTVEAVGQLRASIEGESQPALADGSYGPPLPIRRHSRYRLGPSGKFSPSPN